MSEALPVAQRIERGLTALWYRARFPLRRAKPASLRIARELDPVRGRDDEPVDESALTGRRTTRFLELYSRRGMLDAFAAYGLLDALGARGLRRIDVRFDCDDPFVHRLTVFDGHPSRRVGEVVASRRTVESVGGVALARPGDVIAIEWLTIEDPDADPRDAHLPGQSRPGLGMVRAVIEMALAGATHLGFAAVTAVPAHYHLAWMYHPWFRALEPADEADLLALREATRHLSRASASWSVEEGHVTRDGAVWRWPVPVVCAPLDPALRDHFTSLDYAERVVTSAVSRAPFELATAPPSPR